MESVSLLHCVCQLDCFAVFILLWSEWVTDYRGTEIYLSGCDAVRLFALLDNSTSLNDAFVTRVDYYVSHDRQKGNNTIQKTQND